MSFTGSQVTSVVCLAQSTIVGSLSLRKVRAGSVKTDARIELSGSVDLRYAQVYVFTDVPARWPDDLLLNGLVYQQLEAALPVESRLAWLAKENSGYLPQPYEQLAATYTNRGMTLQHVRCCSPNAAPAGHTASRPSACAATSRTGRSATAIAPPAGSCFFSSLRRWCSLRISLLRPSRPKHCRSMPSSSFLTCCCP